MLISDDQMEKEINKAVGRNVENKDQKEPDNDDNSPAALNPTEDHSAGPSHQNPGGASASTSTDDRHIPNAQIFFYGELEKAANYFSQESKIGEVELGPLYKAQLQSGRIVVVNIVNVAGLKDDRDYLWDLINLSLARHPNLFNLIGFSVETTQPLLVYEFLPSVGSLDKHLHGGLLPGSKLSEWRTRATIALGIARGLNYLHTESILCNRFNDLSTANILLDESFLPRLADFGLAKFDPIVRFRVYSDVFNFGVILLELITGRKHERILQDQGNIELYDWLLPMKEDRAKLYKEVDPRLEGKYERRSLRTAADMALHCLMKERYTERPSITMEEVMRWMDYVVSFAENDS